MRPFSLSDISKIVTDGLTSHPIHNISAFNYGVRPASFRQVDWQPSRLVHYKTQRFGVGFCFLWSHLQYLKICTFQ